MQLERVAFRYRRRAPWVLQDVTLTLSPGQVSEVTGHNGAGKSTLLRLAAGLRAPRRGRITGRPRNVGYAPERFPTDQPFTVRAYLTHMTAVRGLPSGAPAPWTERLRLDHLLDVRLPDLSKGSAQKLGLVQAFLAHPGLLVLDEPFAGLDAATRDALPSIITELASGGSTVMVSDHQRCVEDLPALNRIRVTGNTAAPLPPSPARLLTRPAPPTTPNAPQPPAPSSPPQTMSPPPSITPPPPSLPDGASPEPPNAPTPAWTVLEVTVRTTDAETIARELRAAGHTVHRRDHPPASSDPARSDPPAAGPDS